MDKYYTSKFEDICVGFKCEKAVTGKNGDKWGRFSVLEWYEVYKKEGWKL